MTKRELETLFEACKRYIREQLGELFERDEWREIDHIALRQFEIDYMINLDGGVPLDISIFRAFLRHLERLLDMYCTQSEMEAYVNVVKQQLQELIATEDNKLKDIIDDNKEEVDGLIQELTDRLDNLVIEKESCVFCTTPIPCNLKENDKVTLRFILIHNGEIITTGYVCTPTNCVVTESRVNGNGVDVDVVLNDDNASITVGYTIQGVSKSATVNFGELNAMQLTWADGSISSRINANTPISTINGATLLHIVHD